MDKETENLIPKCFYCNTPLIWETDEMAQDLYEDAEVDDVIQFYHYPICNADYEVYIKTSTNKK